MGLKIYVGAISSDGRSKHREVSTALYNMAFPISNTIPLSVGLSHDREVVPGNTRGRWV